LRDHLTRKPVAATAPAGIAGWTRYKAPAARERPGL